VVKTRNRLFTTTICVVALRLLRILALGNCLRETNRRRRGLGRVADRNCGDVDVPTLRNHERGLIGDRNRAGGRRSREELSALIAAAVAGQRPVHSCITWVIGDCGGDFTSRADNHIPRRKVTLSESDLDGRGRT
jgi:hypothetical protein